MSRALFGKLSKIQILINHIVNVFNIKAPVLIPVRPPNNSTKIISHKRFYEPTYLELCILVIFTLAAKKKKEEKAFQLIKAPLPFSFTSVNKIIYIILIPVIEYLCPHFNCHFSYEIKSVLHVQ